MRERSYKCGACGTEAGGFSSDLTLADFAQRHPKQCPGFPPGDAVSLNERERGLIRSALGRWTNEGVRELLAKL